MPAYSLALLEDTVRLAGELGARGVVIGPGKANPLFPADASELIGYFFAALDRLCPVAQTLTSLMRISSTKISLMASGSAAGAWLWRACRIPADNTIAMIRLVLAACHSQTFRARSPQPTM